MKTMSDYTVTDNGCYIVREEWPDQPFDGGKYHEYMFAPSMKIFKANSWEKSKKDAETYYFKRLKEIRVRKLMFPAIDKNQFILTLLYAETDKDINEKEFIIQVINAQNMPYDEDFKNGLFKELK